MDAAPCEWWHGGLTSHRHHSTAASACEPVLLPSPASPLVDDEEGVLMSKSSAFETNQNRKSTKKQEEESDASETVDSENVNELSDLFSAIESEYDGDSAVDFSMLLEGEHAFNVEEVSEMFTDLEAATPDQEDVTDAAAVDEMAVLFSSLESQHDTDSDRDSTDATDVTEADDLDAENVDELSQMFTALEEKEELSQDWIAALDVEDVSSLFSELERVEEEKRVKPAVAPAAVDPRIFVPNFSIRMEGSSRLVVASLPRVSTGEFLAGPPALLAGPPVRTTIRPTVLEKRPNAFVMSACSPDPSISETRRVCAAKRRRVNGRFVREQNSFVSITSLQP